MFKLNRKYDDVITCCWKLIIEDAAHSVCTVVQYVFQNSDYGEKSVSKRLICCCIWQIFILNRMIFLNYKSSC